jgi:hypothetical protein
MKHVLFLILILSIVSDAYAQQDSTKHFKVGAELDVLPYATGGYFAALWVGKNKTRIRVLTASVNKPDWAINKNYRNHHINAYAIVADRFLKTHWNGWWISGGIVYWKSSIQTNALLQTSNFENFLLNGSIGYNWKFYRQFYLSPWAGISFRTAGDKNVPVDNKQFTLPFINPEASLKIGWHF